MPKDHDRDTSKPNDRASRRRSRSVLAATLAVALGAVLALLPPVPGEAFAPSTVREIDATAESYLHYSLGRLMEIEGLYPEALVQYRRAHSLTPGDCELPTAIARVLLEMGRLEEAIERARVARDGCPEALEPLAVEADALIQSGSAEEAEEIIEASLRRSGAGGGVAETVPTRLVVLLGRALEAQERMGDALALYAASAATDTLEPELAFLNARAHMQVGDIETALAELRRSHRLQPDNRTAAAMLARLLGTLDRHEEALPVLRRLVQRGDATTAEHLALARAYALAGRLDQAHAALDDAERIWGRTPPLMTARASVHFAAGDADSSIALHHRIIEEDPAAVVSLNFLAYHYADAGVNLDEALDLATRARDAAPESGLVRDTLGWTYFRLERYADAVRELELAVSLGATDPVVLEHLGDAYDAVGRREEARAAWTRALELDPDRNTTRQRLLSGETTDEP